MYIVTETLTNPEHLYFKQIDHVHQFACPVSGDGFLPLWVNINYDKKMQFQYDGENLRIDKEDVESSMKQIEEHQKILLDLQEKGLSEEELRKEMEGKGDTFVKRQLYRIHTDGLSVYEILKSFII